MLGSNGSLPCLVDILVILKMRGLERCYLECSGEYRNGGCITQYGTFASQPNPKLLLGQQQGKLES